MSKKAPSPIDPGEILREEFLALGMSPYALSVALYVPRTRIERWRGGNRLDRRHSPAIGTLLRHVGGVLAGPSKPIRDRHREGNLRHDSITRIKPRKVA